jgi:hypothetical protein
MYGTMGMAKKAAPPSTSNDGSGDDDAMYGSIEMEEPCFTNNDVSNDDDVVYGTVVTAQLLDSDSRVWLAPNSLQASLSDEAPHDAAFMAYEGETIPGSIADPCSSDDDSLPELPTRPDIGSVTQATRCARTTVTGVVGGGGDGFNTSGSGVRSQQQTGDSVGSSLCYSAGDGTTHARDSTGSEHALYDLVAPTSTATAVCAAVTAVEPLYDNTEMDGK